MTVTTNSAESLRTGSVRAAAPRSVRSRRRAFVAGPVGAALAIAGVSLVAFAQLGAAPAEAMGVPSVDQIAQAQAQGYTAALVATDASGVVASDRTGDAGTVTVATPEPTTSSSGGSSAVVVADASPGSAQAIAQDMVAAKGWGSEQYQCLYNLWEKESNWRVGAENPSSGAYGIPQSLPGNKMATHGDDWQTNPATQIAWGLDYISAVYGTPCSAWGHSQAVNWY